MAIKAEKSERILVTLIQNVESFQTLLNTGIDDLTRQNVLRSIILFSCSGIDAVVKQLILETLEPVIERDEGAQAQLKKYVTRKLKSDSDLNYNLLADLLTSRNMRRTIIELLKKDLSYDSLQSPEQLFKVASYFNISTNDLLSNEEKDILKKTFETRNIIVHQMDVDLHQKGMHIVRHTADEAIKYYKTIVDISRNYIAIINERLRKDVTTDYMPLFTFEDGAISFHDL